MIFFCLDVFCEVRVYVKKFFRVMVNCLNKIYWVRFVMIEC